MRRLKLRSLLFSIFFVLLFCGLRFVYSEESIQRKLIINSERYDKVNQRSDVLDLPKKSDDNTDLKLSNESEVGKAFDGLLRSQQAWMPRVFKTVKSAFNYLGNSKEGGYGQDHSLQNTICLIAFISIASFLLFFLQPAFSGPKRKRMSQHRRFRNGDPSPYAYKRSPPWGWGAPEQGKHHSSSEMRPIIFPGPALMPLPIPATHVVVPTPTTTIPTPTHSFQHQYKGINPPRNKKRAKSTTSNKNYDHFGASDFLRNSNLSQYDDKLTKDEIFYILKTLDD